MYGKNIWITYIFYKAYYLKNELYLSIVSFK